MAARHIHTTVSTATGKPQHNSSTHTPREQASTPLHVAVRQPHAQLQADTACAGPSAGGSIDYQHQLKTHTQTQTNHKHIFSLTHEQLPSHDPRGRMTAEARRRHTGIGFSSVHALGRVVCGCEPLDLSPKEHNTPTSAYARAWVVRSTQLPLGPDVFQALRATEQHTR